MFKTIQIMALGLNNGQRSQGRQGKSLFPRTAHDMCHSCVGL
jgi:hypothetical protein